MIGFSIRLSNPFVSGERYNRIYNVWGDLTKNKYYEILVTRDRGLLVALSFSWRFRESHAGIDLGIGLLGYDLLIEISDKRHWDYVTNIWEEYDNS